MNEMSSLDVYDRQMERLRKQIEPFLVDVPEGTSGDWTVTHFMVEVDIQAMRAWRDGRPIPPGQYTRLSKSGTGIFMSDTPAEMNDARTLLWRADGHVLITGLGLGMIPRLLFNEEAKRRRMVTGSVSKVTVIELEADVIKLVGPSLADLPVEIVHADAFEYEPPKGTVYNWAWHDIWPDMCEDNRPQFSKLRRRFQKHMIEAKRQLVWSEDHLNRSRRSGRW